MARQRASQPESEIALDQPSGDVEVTRVVELHYELIDAYVRILREVERLPAVAREQPHGGDVHAESGGFPLVHPWRSIVRLAVHAHMKRILKSLGSGYVIEGQRRRYQSHEREWLRETANGCQATASALGRPRLRAVVLAVGPVLLGAVLATLDVTGLFRVGADATRGLSVWGWLAVGTIYVPFFLVSWPLLASFNLKRTLMYPAVRVDERKRILAIRGLPETPEVPLPPGQNVYLLENQLFSEMQMPKPPEFRAEWWWWLCFGLLGAMAVGVLVPVFIHANWPSDVPSSVLVAIGAIVALVPALLLARLWWTTRHDPRWR